MANKRVFVTDMGAVYSLSKANWRKWLRDFQSSGEKPDINDAKYKANCLAYTHRNITDWTLPNVEWLNPDEDD